MGLDQYNYENIANDHAQWTASIFGEQYYSSLNAIWNTFYHLAFIRKPEYMGWGREHWMVDEVLTDTEFSFCNYNEVEKKLTAYNKISDMASNLLKQLPENKKAAFFQLVYHPVKGACFMNKKILIAQKSRLYAKPGQTHANSLAANAWDYFDSLNIITNQYNSLLNGKWDGMMSLKNGWNSSVHKMPDVDSVSIVQKTNMSIFPEGYNLADTSSNMLSLPDFNSFAPKEYYIDIVNNASELLKWKIHTSSDWINISNQSGKIKNKLRIYVSIDWDKIPLSENIQGQIVIKNNNEEVSVCVNVFNPLHIDIDRIKGLFVEQNGYISIPAADFHRKTDDEPIHVVVLDNIGIENKAIQFGAPLNRVLDESKRFTTSVEYDFIYSLQAGLLFTLMLYLYERLIPKKRPNLCSQLIMVIVLM